MAVEKFFGIPLISRIYRPNCHDSKLFSHILADLIVSLKALCKAETDLVFVLDKGNNSKDNFSYMKGKINWIGSLVPSHHKDLIDMELSQYHGVWKDKRYYRCKKVVMSIKCSIILTFSASRKRKQRFGKSLVFSNMIDAETGYLMGLWGRRWVTNASTRKEF